MNKAIFQIGAWMSSEEVHALARYATECHIDNDALGSLLLVRELNLARASGLVGQYKKSVSSKNRKRFTVRSSDKTFVANVDNHAKLNEMTKNELLGLILRAELEECWLSNSCKY